MSSTWYPPPSRPRPVEGGIKARSTRGAIAQTWWSERFIAVLEDIGLGNRLQRGRSYARKGQVISLQVDAGLVTALVQGSRARPYRSPSWRGVAASGRICWPTWPLPAPTERHRPPTTPNKWPSRSPTA